MTASFADPMPSGRPIGYRPGPEPPSTVAEFVQESLASPIKPPPPPPPKPRDPKRKAGIWEKMTPEERSEHAKALAAKRSPANMARKGRTPGTPNGWDHTSVAVAKVQARMEATELVSKLIAEGKIHKQDKAGAEATIEALTIVRSPGGNSNKLRWAKRLLRFYHPELAVELL